MAKHIIFVHGIGVLGLRVAEEFRKNIGNDARMHLFQWKKFALKSELKLYRSIEAGQQRQLKPNALDRLETPVIRRLKKLFISYMGDALYYMYNSESIHKQLLALLEKACKKDKKASITIVSHSMGTVIAHDLLSSNHFRKRAKRKSIKIADFFTAGSPIAFFLMRKKKVTASKLPISGKWTNVYDKRDIIASPLTQFFPQCTDIEVRLKTANPLLVHKNYFSNQKVISMIHGTSS